MSEAIRTKIIKIRAVKRSRIGWDEAFATMAESGDDRLLDDVSTTTWDQVEWE